MYFSYNNHMYSVDISYSKNKEWKKQEKNGDLNYIYNDVGFIDHCYNRSYIYV